MKIITTKRKLLTIQYFFNYKEKSLSAPATLSHCHPEGGRSLSLAV